MTTRNNKNNYTKNNSYPSTDYVVGINWILFVVLSVTTHFVPEYLDYIISFICLLWNIYTISNTGLFALPIWVWLIFAAQIYVLMEGFKVDHDPLDGEWHGPNDGYL